MTASETVPNAADAETRPARTRLTPAERRERILEAARRCCMRSGAFALSLAEVAVEAGISRNLVYHYFRNHTALLDALLEAEGRILAGRIEAFRSEPGEAPEAALRRLVCIFLDFTAERAEGFTLLHNAPSMKPLVRERFDASLGLIFGRILAILDIPDAPASRAAVGAATGFLMRFAYAERGELAAERDAAADLCVGVILAAAEGVRRFRSVSGAR